MIVEKPKQETAEKWWVGKPLTCSRCGTKVTLEKTDTPVSALHTMNDTLNGKPMEKRTVEVLMLTCPNCGGGIEATQAIETK